MSLLQNLLDLHEGLLVLEHIEMCEDTLHFGEDMQELGGYIFRNSMFPFQIQNWHQLEVEPGMGMSPQHTFRSMLHQLSPTTLDTYALYITAYNIPIIHTHEYIHMYTLTTHTEHTVHGHGINTRTHTRTLTHTHAQMHAHVNTHTHTHTHAHTI